jgi:type IV secretory pathway VirB10-like protein
MSAPQTNLATQSRWHRAPIIGMIVVVVFALGLLFWQMIMVAGSGTPTDSGAAQIDGRTGAQVPDASPPAGDPPATPDGDLPAPALPDPAPDTPVTPVTPPESVAP